ncbi:MAG: aspartyl-phosphate phosphatase Spo0E family protein [Clostridia bacterium]
MLNDEICKLREKLNNSILSGEDYSITYQISVELDELIAKYYSMEIKSQNKNVRIMQLAKG